MPKHFKEKENKGDAPVSTGQLRAGKPREWYEKLMNEEPAFSMKGAPRSNSSKVRLRPKICEAILGGAIPEFRKDDYRNLHPDDLQTLICAAFGHGKANVASQALKECEWDFASLTAEQKTLVYQGLKNGTDLQKGFFAKLQPDDLQALICACAAYGKNSLIGAALHQYDGNFTALSAEQKGLLEKGIRDGTTNADFLKDNLLDRLERADRMEIIKALVGKDNYGFSLIAKYQAEMGDVFFEPRGAMWKLIAENNLNIIFSQENLKLLLPENRKKAFDLLIGKRLATCKILVGYGNEISDEGIKEAIAEMVEGRRFSGGLIDSDGLSRLMLGKRKIILEALIDNDLMDYRIFDKYSHEIEDGRFNRAVFGMIRRKELWVDEALSQYRSRLDLTQLSGVIIEKISDGTIMIEDALKKYPGALTDFHFNCVVFSAINDGKLQIGEALDKYADRLDNEWMLRTILKMIGKQAERRRLGASYEQISPKLLSFCRKFDRKQMFRLMYKNRLAEMANNRDEDYLMGPQWWGFALGGAIGAGIFMGMFDFTARWLVGIVAGGAAGALLARGAALSIVNANAAIKSRVYASRIVRETEKLLEKESCRLDEGEHGKAG